MRNLSLLTNLKFDLDVTSCQMIKQLASSTTSFLRWTLLHGVKALAFSVIGIYMVFAFRVSFEPVYTSFCSMWWALDPDGFWGKGNADAVEVSFTSHLPTFLGANTGHLLSLSLLPQTHLPPPKQPPRSYVFQCFHYFKDRLALKKSQWVAFPSLEMPNTMS